jgi:ceramide glucosyltransferase
MYYPDVTSVFLTLCEACLAVAVAATVFTLIESFFVLRFSTGRHARTGAQPAVTILKPLHGAEPDLLGRLAQFCEQDYAGPMQIVCGVKNESGPAAAVVRQLKADFPGQPIDLAADTRNRGSNRKMSKLLTMLPRARYDTVVLSDSDIVVGPDYLRGITALLATPRVGAVTCLYYGIGEGLWSRLSALATNVHFLPELIMATRLGVARHCCGATIAMRRSALDRIGGFGEFADTLADDYAMGAALRSAGYEIVTAPFLVGHRCFETNARQLVSHQMRVARTIKSIEPIGYAGTFITHPWPLALIGALSGSSPAVLAAAAALVSRLVLCWCVERRFDLPRQSYWLVPLYDMIAFGIYVTSFFGTSVHWRGVDYTVSADGTLIENEAEQTST